MRSKRSKKRELGRVMAAWAVLTGAAVCGAQMPVSGPQVPVSGAQLPVSAAQKPLSLAVVSRLPACKADQLSLATDGENGSFDGMSHSGVLLVVRNLGPAACRVVPMAEAQLLDKDGKPLEGFSAAVPGARFMHPGPVVLPVALASGAELTANFRWVSGEVYTNNVCLDPAALELRFGAVTLRTALQGHLCGERGKGVSAELGRFAPDPVVVPAGSH